MRISFHFFGYIYIYIYLLKTDSLDNAIQDFFISLAIMVYELIYHNLQVW